MLGGIFKAALGWAAATYVNDLIVRPKQVAALARSYCDRVGKPLLNIGAGATGIRGFVAGPTLWGDVNIDPAGPPVPHGQGNVSYGNPYDLREWPNGHFGAVIAAHVLENLERPDLALIEWRRAADKVFVVVPPWWTPHAWLGGKRWFITPDLKAAWPVWTNRNQIYLLPVPSPGHSPDQWAKTIPVLPPKMLQSLPSPSAPSSSETETSPTTEGKTSGLSGSVSALTVISTGRSSRP